MERGKDSVLREAIQGGMEEEDGIVADTVSRSREGEITRDTVKASAGGLNSQ